MNKSISLVLLNTQGFRAKSLEIENLIEKINPDIFFFQETMISENDPYKISFPSYVTKEYRRVGKGGGLAIGIKKHLNFNFGENLTSAKANELMQIELITSSGKCITISNYYNKKSKNIDINQLNDILKHPDNIVIGDLNCKHNLWGSSAINPGGILLANSIDSHNYHHSYHTSPTRFSSINNDVLDIAVWSKQHLSFSNINNHSLEDVGSDHLPILFTINGNFEKPSPTPRVITQYHKVNWNNINDKLLTLNKTITTKIELDNQIEKIEKCISIIYNNIPKVIVKSQNNGISIDIKQKIREKRKLLKAYKRTKNPNIKTKINQLNKSIKLYIKTKESDKINNDILKMNSNESKIKWNTINNTLKEKHTSDKINKITDPSTNNTTTDPHEISDIFARSLKNTFKGNDLTSKPFKETINRWHRNFKNEDCFQHYDPDDPFFSVDKISKIIKNLDNNKAPGVDNITNTIIKYLEPSLKILLHEMYNFSYEHSYFPKRWKTAKITMIYKNKGSKFDPSNYRPISLLPQFGKIFEKLISDKLYLWCDMNNILNQEQSGFRKGRSTNDHLFLLTQYVTEGFNQKKQTDAIFIDFEKCFDKIWQEGLLFKLHSLNLPRKDILIIKSFLEERLCFISINGINSFYFSPDSGLPQGSCLSPILS